MDNILFYLVQATSIFSLCYLIYVVLFKKLTFHTSNRVLLLLFIPTSLVIPVLGSLFPSFSNVVSEVSLLNEVASSTNFIEESQVLATPSSDTSLSFITFLFTIYSTVVLIYLIKMITTARRLSKLKRDGIIKEKNGYQLIITDVPEIFSYFKYVFIPKNQYDRYNKTQILAHEAAHIALRHSWDVVLSELFIAFFWFNPLVYMYRNSLKSIHEYQADRKVVNIDGNALNYLQLLLTTIHIKNPNSLYNYFNHPILKKRIDMMTKSTSNTFAKLAYLLFLPIGILLVSAFAEKQPIANKEIPFKGSMNFHATEIAPPALFPVKGGAKSDITAYFGKKGKHPKANKGIIHQGIDIRAIEGTPIIATADGVIAKARLEGNWGNLIVIMHNNGYETWYAHLQGFNTKKQQSVQKGDIIGYVGNTGKSTGPHLHYEVRQHGKNLNPINYLK